MKKSRNQLYKLSRCKRLKRVKPDAKLPYRNLKWDDEVTEADEINDIKALVIFYILEVHLEYPKDLHDLCALAPEVMNLGMLLSEKQEEIYWPIIGNKKPKDEKAKKLIF